MPKFTLGNSFRFGSKRETVRNFHSENIETILKKLTKDWLEQFARDARIQADLIGWKKMMVKIYKVLDDAIEKQTEEESVMIWLGKLQHLACDVDYLLDEFQTEAFQTMLLQDADAMSKVKEVNARLQDIAWQINVLGLQEISGGKSRNVGLRFLTTPSLLLAAVRGGGRDRGPTVFSPLIEKEDLAFLEKEDCSAPLEKIGSEFPRKHKAGSQKEVMGVLSFEVVSLMSKVVHLWQSLSNEQIVRLRAELLNSVGIKKLVSEDDEFIASLICSEMIEVLAHVAKSVARLGKKCNDQGLKSFEIALDKFVNIGADPYGWEFSWKKMEKKVKKMEHFISIYATWYQEIEMLEDHIQTLERMKSNDGEIEHVIEFQKKVAWKKQEVKNLGKASLWRKTYDNTIPLLGRSLFTLFGRIRYVFGINVSVDVEDSRDMSSDYIYRSQSVSALLQSSVHPSENTAIARFSSGPPGKFTANSGPISKPKRMNNYHSGPLSAMSTKLGPSMMAADISPVANRYSIPNILGALNEAKESNVKQIPQANRVQTRSSIFSSKGKLLDASPETLGGAALALHYSKVVIVIEKLVASPQLIGHDAREDLYNMLPASVRATLRARLKPYTKSLASSVYDTEIAGEWTAAMSEILEWLAPLAHNMIRWQSERSFEQQRVVSRSNVLLVQTLYFANQEKTEAAITELLVGLNYVWRYSR
ncbi:hypothetical protein AB3S75_023076 [Citrus x aurantiifolia]